MDGQAVVPKKKRGPAPTGKGIQIQVRLQPDMLAALDDILAKEETRPEAIRRIVRKWLIEHGHLAADQ